MILGLLNACTPADEAEFGATELASFQAFLDQVEHNFTLVEYRITEGDFPPSPTACAAYLITGSPKGVYDSEPWIAQLQEFIRACYATGQKMVGICFGHQILAHALGGHTEKSEKGWGLGRSTVELVAERPWMQPPLPTGGFYFCHQDQVKRLPASAALLAGNTFCPNGMFVIGEQIVGLQAHPEFTAENMRREIDLLRPKLDAPWLAQVEAVTHGYSVDNAIMAQWLVNFLTAKEAHHGTHPFTGA